mgnify:CR=1 FL=1
MIEELERIRQNEAGKPYSSRTHLTDDDIQRWSTLIGKPRSALYDQIAVYLARGFHCSELEFEFCDAVVNDIHAIITLANDVRPDLFWEVYLAFDEGEYHHSNKREEDPVEVYTRPLIARFIDKIP